MSTNRKVELSLHEVIPRKQFDHQPYKKSPRCLVHFELFQPAWHLFDLTNHSGNNFENLQIHQQEVI